MPKTFFGQDWQVVRGGIRATMYLKRRVGMKKMNKAGKVAASLLAAVVAILLAIWLFRVPSGTLQPWHKTAALQKPHEFAGNATFYPDFKAADYRRFYQNYRTFAEYMAVERQFIRDICAQVTTDAPASRYHSEPDTGNFSFELQPDSITAGVLLVHGLSDSPHHIRALAEIFREQGCYVIGLRLPGHGTIPAALLEVDRKDWRAAVAFGAAMVQKRLSHVPGQPKFYAGGFSTGGALVLQYALNALEADTSSIGAPFRKPDKLFFFSPAIAVSPLAILANWHKAVSWLPGFEKLKWADLIELEDDPCKYNSFPKNAGDQIHLLTKENRKRVQQLRQKGEHAGMPPMFAFQSTVDATVIADALVQLYATLANPQSELFLFDINRSAELLEFVAAEKKALNHRSYSLSQLTFRYTFITNRETGGPVFAYTWGPGSSLGALSTADTAVALAASWPEKTVCLSHVAVPISPQDPLYGRASRYAQLPGAGYLLAENEVLNDGAKPVRLRYNPFFGYLASSIRRAIQVKSLAFHGKIRQIF